MQDYDECVANQLMDDLRDIILEFEAEHHLDLIVKFEPECWCYTSDMNYMDVSELLREFFLSHYSGYSWYRNDVLSIDVFGEITEECENKSISEFCDEIINVTKKLLNEHIAPIIDKHWPKIEDAMSKVQKYFPGLKITMEYADKWGYDVSIIYFTRNGRLISEEFNPDELLEAYYTIDRLCYELIYVGTDAPFLKHYRDEWFGDMYRFISEDQRDEIDPSKYAIVEYTEECNFRAIMNVFKYFDKNNDIKIKDGWN